MNNFSHTNKNKQGCVLQQFRDRLKEMRRNNLYTVRNISEHVDKLKNLRKALSIDGSVLTPTEIIELLEEVENEIHFENNHTQCDQYINDTNVILEELMTGVTFCPICDKVLEHTDIINNICKQCSDSFNVK